MRRVPGSRSRRSGSKRGRKPSLKSCGSWIASCAKPPTRVSADQVMTAVRDDGAMKYTTTPPAMATRLNIDDESAGAVYRSSALSAPMATTASDTVGRNGSMMRTSVAHSAAFSGENPVAMRCTTGPGKSMATPAITPR